MKRKRPKTIDKRFSGIFLAFVENVTISLRYRAKMGETSIEEMCLSVRSTNGLMRSGANTFGKLKELMERQNGLRSVRNLGAKSEKEIKLRFFNDCYSMLNEYEKAEWWQGVIDQNPDAAAQMPDTF